MKIEIYLQFFVDGRYELYKYSGKAKNVKIENYLEFFGDGRYEFYKCSGCFGPQLGHITQKCTKLKYESDTVKEFEIYLKEIGGFKEAIWRREKEKETEREKIRAKEMVDAAAAAAQTGTTATAGTAGGVAQRKPPTWTGQQFDRWKVEITNWHDNGRGNEEENILDLIESLKKNEAIKAFVNSTLIEKVGETRTVYKVLEMISEKLDRNMSEKTLDMMRKISGEGFKSDKSVDKMMDIF